jgi:hypothetical protein
MSSPPISVHLKCPHCGSGLTNNEAGRIVCSRSGQPIGHCEAASHIAAVSSPDPDDPLRAPEEEPDASLPFHPDPDCPRCDDTGLIRGGPSQDAICPCSAGEARAWEVRNG